MGRQPWAIQDYLPTVAAASRIDASSVQVTFWLFAVLFTVLLVAEVSILVRQIRKGPEPSASGQPSSELSASDACSAEPSQSGNSKPDSHE
jgi:cytochrome d ubiquinol oxidase subunit I